MNTVEFSNLLKKWIMFVALTVSGLQPVSHKDTAKEHKI